MTSRNIIILVIIISLILIVSLLNAINWQPTSYFRQLGDRYMPIPKIYCESLVMDGDISGSGAGVTNINAKNITSGKLSNDRLRSTVCIENEESTITAAWTFDSAIIADSMSINRIYIDSSAYYLGRQIIKAGDTISNFANDSGFILAGDTLSQLVNDSNFIEQFGNISNWKNDSLFVESGGNISNWTNDENYTKSGDNISVFVNNAGYVKQGDTVSSLVNDAGYLKSGDNISELTNNSGYITGDTPAMDGIEFDDGYLNRMKKDAIKLHQTNTITPDKDAWLDLYFSDTPASETQGSAFSVTDSATIKSNTKGFFIFGGCLHFQNNSGGDKTPLVALRLWQNGATEVRCSQRAWVGIVKDGGENVLTTNGTVYLNVNDTIKMQYYTDDDSISFISNAVFANQIAATVWLVRADVGDVK